MINRKITRYPWPVKGLCTAAAVMLMGLASASAQLAITEVMSLGSIGEIENQVKRQSDWWELTNFGTNEFDLTDYTFTDIGDDSGNFECFAGLVIRPGKSVIFFRIKETLTEAEFREWWGDCFGTNLQAIVSWLGQPGFNPDEDAVHLYLRLKDGQRQLVDSVELGPAKVGTTFVSSPDTGEFGEHSKLGECGTCKSATANDIGSPGTACGPVKLHFLQQPSNLVVCAGSDATFSARAGGLPRPRYQWLFKGEPIQGATSNQYVIADPKFEDIGEYQVVASNGLERILSTIVTLDLNTNPCPPQLIEEPSDQEVFVGETARFSAFVCAVPRPQFQWAANGVDMVGETSRILVIPNATLEASGTIYSLRIWNAMGTNNTSAQLLVHPRPTLAITEVTLAPSPSSPYSDLAWWELTNLGTTDVNLKGFRHSDRNVLSSAKVITNEVVIQPGESVIFVDQLSPDEFIGWWGRTNLPLGLQVITYVGYGLNRWADAIFVWSAAEESSSRALAAMDYTTSTQEPHVPIPCPCDPEKGCTSMCDQPIDGRSIFFVNNETNCAFWGQCSEENESGAFRAERYDDVGSPGFYVLPRCFGIQYYGSTVTMQWRVVKGKRYQVEWRPEVEAGVWAIDGIIHTAQGSTLIASDTLPDGAPRRFYRLRELP